MKKAFTAGKLLAPAETVEQAVLVVEDGVIASIFSRLSQELPAACEVVDFGDKVLAPAYFDQHLHGCAGYDVMQATPAALGGIGCFLAAHGVAGYLATTVTASLETTLASLSGLAKLIANNSGAGGSGAGGSGAGGRGADECPAQAVPVGIHLEGPFLSHEKRGVHPPELLLPPTVALFERFWQAAEGKIRLMTIAPELPNAAEVIAHATSLGVRISLGHSNATTPFAKAGVAAGAVSATHTFNAMRNFDQREPGILGVVLDDGNLYAEIIADGFHVDPSVVRLFWKAKGAERAILVTDGISATGMPDGMYKLGTLDVQVKDGKCLAWSEQRDGTGGDDKSAGTIAGSTLTMDRAVTNFSHFTGARLDQVVGLATKNPARMLGLDDRFGALAAGRVADFVALDQTGALQATVLAGSLTKSR